MSTTTETSVTQALGWDQFPHLIECPQPGKYPGVPEEEYHRWAAAAQSTLKVMAMKSPAHARHQLAQPSEPTPAMALGTAAHFAFLEPELFEQRYVVAEQCEAVTGKGTRCSYEGKCRVDGHWFCGTHRKGVSGENDAVHVLSAGDHAKAQAIAIAARSHPMVRLLLDGAQHFELAAVWEDEATGLRCKLRADLVGEVSTRQGSFTFAADLKTCTEADPVNFERRCFDMGYFVQAAHYTHGLAKVGLPIDHFIIIPVESSPYHGVMTHCFEAEVLEEGWKILHGREGRSGAYHRFRECLHSGRWPGYDTSFHEIGLPGYAFRHLYRGDERFDH